MSALIFFRYLHFISVIGLTGGIIAEQLLIKSQLTRAEKTGIGSHTIDALIGFAHGQWFRVFWLS